MKLRSKLLLFIAFVSLHTLPLKAQRQNDRVKEMLEHMTKDEIINHLTITAGDETEGRESATAAQKTAANYIRNIYKNLELEALPGTDAYFPTAPSDAMKRMFSPKPTDSQNVAAY